MIGIMGSKGTYFGLGFMIVCPVTIWILEEQVKIQPREWEGTGGDVVHVLWNSNEAS